jgi:hypothetical protein
LDGGQLAMKLVARIAFILLVAVGLIVDVPFYYHGIWTADWWFIMGSHLDPKSLPPFTWSPFLRMFTTLGFPVLVLGGGAFVVALAVAMIRRRKLDPWACAAIAVVTLLALPVFLHEGRLVSWYLD